MDAKLIYISHTNNKLILKKRVCLSDRFSVHKPGPSAGHRALSEEILKKKEYVQHELIFEKRSKDNKYI